MLNGSLDVIAAICTLVIKVCFVLSCLFFLFIHVVDKLFPYTRFSHQVSKLSHLKSFRSSVEYRILLKIPLHSNVQWGTTYTMLSRLYMLHLVCFLSLSYVPHNQQASNYSWLIFSLQQLPINVMAQLQQSAAMAVLWNTSLGLHSICRRWIGPGQKK